MVLRLQLVAFAQDPFAAKTCLHSCTIRYVYLLGPFEDSTNKGKGTKE
jgi:hypothetical protein